MAEFALPEPLHNRRGEIRKVGVELEFAGMSLTEAAEAVQEAFGGELVHPNEWTYKVRHETLGDFDVSFDSSALKRNKPDDAESNNSPHLLGQVKEAVQGLLRRIGESVVPLEISTPPLPVDQLSDLEKLESALRARKALGTKASPFYAFALHFNPESPDPESAEQTVRTLRAFLLLYEWLFRRAHIDWTRRLLPFIDPFPRRYAQRVIDPDYAPDFEQFTKDYVADNPTRNRPLDLLPLLAYNDAGVRDLPELAGYKIKPRPTYHYRLPNSLIDDPQWSIAQEWEQWVMIERLAANTDDLHALSRKYLDWHPSLSSYLGDRWHRYLNQHWIPKLQHEPVLR